MKPVLLLVFLSGLSASAFGSSLTVQILGTTSTQAILTYKAPDANPCTVAVSKSSATNSSTGAFLTLVHDVDPSLFTGANLDTRAGNVVNGTVRTIVLGMRGTGDGSDGNVYSRALQASTTHYFQISCDSGAATASGTFTTTNLPLGNSAPDPVQYDSNGWNGWGWPTINYSDNTVEYIDPQTGILLKRWTKPGDSSGSIERGIPANQANDLANSWQNARNIGGAPDGNYATYTGSGGPTNALFLWGKLSFYQPNFLPSTFNVLDDIQLHLGGFGNQPAAADRTVGTCLSADFGQTCVGSEMDIVLPQITASDVMGPATFPGAVFSGWGNAHVTPDMLTGNYSGTLASVNGTTVTWGANAANGYNIYFPVTALKAAAKILISGSDPTCPGNLCTIASTVNETTLTIQQNLGTWSPLFTSITAAVSAGATTFSVQAANGFVESLWGPYSITLGSDSVSCTTLTGTTFSGCSGVATAHAAGASIGQNQYLFPNFGFKIWKKTANGEISIDSSKSDWATSAGFFTDYQGSAAPYCSSTTVTANYAADGVTPIAPLPGYTCLLEDNWGNNILYFVAPSTGEARKLSNLVSLSLTAGQTPTDFYGYDTNAQAIKHCSYSAADTTNGLYKNWSDGYNFSGGNNPAFTCANLTQAGNTVPHEIAAAYPNIDQTYFGAPAFQSVAYPLFEFMLRPAQGALAWFCILDVTKAAGAAQVIKCRNNWDTYPIRWQGSHGNEYFMGDNYTFMNAQSPLESPGQAGIEQWQLNVLQVYNNGGSTAVANTFFDPQTCQALGVTDPRWIAQGATGQKCIHINVDNEPMAKSPAAADLKTLGSLPAGARPAAWAHNAASCGGDGTTSNCWSYLQPLAEGDYLQDASLGLYDEKFLVAKKTLLSNGTIDLVLARNMNPFSCQTTATPENHAAGWVPLAWPPQTCSTGDYVSQVYQSASQSILDNPQTYLGHTVAWFTPQGNQLHATSYGWNLDTSLGGYGAAYGIRNGTFPGIVGQTFTYGVQSVYPFGGDNHGVSINQVQTHPGGITTSAPARESGWAVDGRPLGGTGGGSQYLWNQNLTSISGTQNVYQLSLPLNPNGSTISFSGWDVSLSRKYRAMVAFAGYHLLADISGPGSQISDSTPWSYCIADFAGECQSGSAQGSIYVSVPNASRTGICSNDGTIFAPCVATAGPEVGGYTQFDISRADSSGLRWRRLTDMFNGPGRTDNYANMHALATGDWAVSSVKWGDGRRSDIFGVKLPPWPQEDSIVRNSFVNVPVSLGGSAGASIRVRFGYAPNLYCSSRSEQCSTAVANSDPYAWLSETQRWKACASGSCTINIPAISNRILYYVVDRMDASGTVVSAPLMVTAVN